MLIESDPHQTRIAVLEDDRLTEIFVERHRHRGLVGNIYKGRVTRVLPGMQAAFVDVGLERDAFLYVSDVAADVESMEDLEIDDGRSDEIANNNNHRRQVSPSIDDLPEGGAGDHRPGGQGPAPQQGGAHQHARHPAGPLPGAAADRAPLRRLAADRGRGRARAPPLDPPAAPRGTAAAAG